MELPNSSTSFIFLLMSVFFILAMGDNIKITGFFIKQLSYRWRLLFGFSSFVMFLLLTVIFFKNECKEEIIDGFYVTSFLNRNNIGELKDFPIHSEVFQARNLGNSIYQIYICNDISKSGVVAVTSNFKNCPFDQAKPKLGPTLELDKGRECFS